MIGRTLGQFRIIDQLGSGGMGEVYRARDTRLDRDVALKILPQKAAADPERTRRFQQEARVLAALDHPNLVGVFTVDEDQGIPFLTMPLVRGRTLDAVIGEEGLELDTFLSLGVQLADGLIAAHARGIVHRDLKPTNVMITDDDRVRVLDFGLAKLLDPPSGTEAATAMVSRTGEVLGTIAYMSPEQVEGQALDDRSDIFSLGVLFHEMLSGTHPFRGETTAATIASILRSPPPPPGRADLPADLIELCQSCLRKSAQDRPDARAVRDRLEELRRPPRAAEGTDKPSIAILPFSDMSPEKDQDSTSARAWPRRS